VITHLDHIAIAVPDLAEAISRFAEDFGLQLSGCEDVPTEQTATAFFPIDGTRIELVSPMDGQGPIATSLEKRGPGIHHICFRSDDLVADMARLSAKGYRFINTEPKPGAHGSKVAFIHPKSTGGVLIELAQLGPDS
jgi:methylmalonyl-CoA/ethylmalonyl-CoA epimerase